MLIRRVRILGQLIMIQVFKASDDFRPFEITGCYDVIRWLAVDYLRFRWPVELQVAAEDFASPKVTQKTLKAHGCVPSRFQTCLKNAPQAPASACHYLLLAAFGRGRRAAVLEVCEASASFGVEPTVITVDRPGRLPGAGRILGGRSAG